MVALKIAAYCAYLAAWVIFALAAVAGAWPRRRDEDAPDEGTGLKGPVIIGTALQVLAAIAITGFIPSGPLQPQPWEMAGALGLAPAGAALYVWALRSAPREAGRGLLVTSGAYRWLRHPMYLAFLAMLVATGLLVSCGPNLILPVLLYLGGSELRVSAEEMKLTARFPREYEEYRSRTRWRYFPGVR